MSKLEERIIEVVKGILGDITCRREVQVKSLFKEYISSRDRYDLVFPSFKLIIECHGAQHSKIIPFGKQKAQTAYSNFTDQKRRDKRKKEIAIQNGWKYLAIWYHEISGSSTDYDVITRKLNTKG